MKLLKMYAFLLALLFIVSPIFAAEDAETETTLPAKKYVEFTLGGTYTDHSHEKNATTHLKTYG